MLLDEEYVDSIVIFVFNYIKHTEMLSLSHILRTVLMMILLLNIKVNVCMYYDENVNINQKIKLTNHDLHT